MGKFHIVLGRKENYSSMLLKVSEMINKHFCTCGSLYAYLTVWHGGAVGCNDMISNS